MVLCYIVFWRSYLYCTLWLKQVCEPTCLNVMRYCNGRVLDTSRHTSRCSSHAKLDVGHASTDLIVFWERRFELSANCTARVLLREICLDFESKTRARSLSQCGDVHVSFSSSNSSSMCRPPSRSAPESSWFDRRSIYFRRSNLNNDAYGTNGMCFRVNQVYCESRSP